MSLDPFEVMMPAKMTDASELFETTELDDVTNLAGEHGIRIEEGDDYRVSAPSNWDPNEWAFACWFIPDFDNTDGIHHPIAQIKLNGSNRILIRKENSDTLNCYVVGGGTSRVASLSKSFSAGDTVFFGGRLTGGTLTVYADTDSDGTLETDSQASITTVTDGTFEFEIGQNVAAGREFEGALNLLITDDGSSDDPIEDRFNGGNGMALEDWLATVNDGGSGLPHSENLVLHVGGNSDGSGVQLDTFAGASQLLSDPEDGGYSFGSTDYIDFGNATDLDGASNASWFFEIENTGSSVSRAYMSRWGSTNATKQFRIQTDASKQIYVEFATDLSGNSAWATGDVIADGTRFLVWVRFAGGGASNSDRLKVAIATYNSSTRSYGAFTDQTLSFNGTIPSILTTPSSSVDLRLGESASGSGNPENVNIYDARLAPRAINTGQLDAQELDQAYHDEWDHWWPLEGDADDQIGSLDGTINGATSVTDGRSLSGRFERYTRQGRYNFDGVDDYISLGNWQGLDGTTDFSMFGVFTVDETGSAQILFARDDQSSERQIGVFTGNKFEMILGTDLSGGISRATGDTTLVAGTSYAFWARYDGGGASNADRLKFALSEYDAATGTYAAFTEETISFSGTIPSSLITPGSSITAYFGRDSSGNEFNGKIDHWAIDNDTAWPTSTLNDLSVYSPPEWEHGWPFDGNANDSEGSLDGTVTGAQQVADGRQPVGWTTPGMAAGVGEVDRATGSNEAAEGSYGLRAQSPSADVSIAQQTSPSVTAERWVTFLASARETDAEVVLRMSLDSNSDAAIPTQASMANVGVAARVSSTGTKNLLIRSTAASAEAYIDDLRAYELATVSPSTATKALPSRVPFSVTKPGSGHPYVAMAIAGDESIEAWARNDSGTQFGPAGGDTALSTGWATIGFGYDGSDIYVTVNGSKESTTVALSGDFDDLAETTIGAARLGVVSHFVGIGASIELGRVLVWDNSLTDEERKNAHNLLRERYDQLPEAT